MSELEIARERVTAILAQISANKTNPAITETLRERRRKRYEEALSLSNAVVARLEQALEQQLQQNALVDLADDQIAEMVEDQGVESPDRSPSTVLVVDDDVPVAPVVRRAPSVPVEEDVEAGPSNVRVSTLQERVAKIELKRDLGKRPPKLYSGVPALAVRASIIDSMWAESGKTSQAAIIAAARGSDAEELPIPTSEIGAVVAKPMTARDSTERGLAADDIYGYDTQIALILEHAAPLLNDSQRAYDQGDAYRYSDTYLFTGDDAGYDPTDPDYVFAFTFTPSRFDAAVSFQPLVNADRKFEVLRANRPVFLPQNTNVPALGTLKNALVSQSSLVPEMMMLFDWRQTLENARPFSDEERARIPTDLANDSKRGFLDKSGPAYPLLESLQDYAYSRRAVLAAASAAVSRQLIGTRGEVSDSSAFARELLRSPPDASLSTRASPSSGGGDGPSPTDLGDEYEERALVKLAEIESLLSEYDEGSGAVGVLRAQSVNKFVYGPYYVVDDVREYELNDPFGSLTRALSEVGDEGDFDLERALEARLQRHSQTPLRPDPLLPRFYSRAVARRIAPQFRAIGAIRDDDDMSDIELPQVAPEPIGRPPALRMQKLDANDSVTQPRTKRVLKSRIREDKDDEDADVDDKLVAAKRRRQTSPSQAHAIAAMICHTGADGDEDETDEEDEGSGEELEGVDINDEIADYNDNLGNSASVVRSSPAIFTANAARVKRTGYFGAVVSVPMDAQPRRLLQRVAVASNWRQVAGEIFLLAVYYKLLPELYSDEFPDDAVEWLLSALTLFRARVNTAQQLYASNVKSVFLKRAQSAAQGLAAIDKLLVESGTTIAALPPVIAVGVDADLVPTTGTQDEQIASLIYATYGRRPDMRLGLDRSKPLERDSTAQLVADSYPYYDTYGAELGKTGAFLQQNLRFAEAVQNVEQASAIAPIPGQTLWFDNLVDKVGSVDAAKIVARAFYPAFVEGEHNDVTICYIPLPDADERSELSSLLDVMKKAEQLYDDLHNNNGALDATNLSELLVARDGDRATMAALSLGQRCLEPAYRAAAIAYATENFAAHQKTLEYHHAPASETQEFGVFSKDDGGLLRAETLAELLSADWLGGGRVAVESRALSVAANASPDIDHYVRTEGLRVPFFYLVSPPRFISWLRAVATAEFRAADQDASVDIDLTDGPSGGDRVLAEQFERWARQLESEISSDSTDGVYEAYQNYRASLRQVEADFARLGLSHSARADSDGGRIAPELATTRGVLRLAANLVRDERRLLLLPLADYLVADNRTLLPFGRIDDCDPDSPTIKVWFEAAHALRWFQLGYLQMPFNLGIPIKLRNPRDRSFYASLLLPYKALTAAIIAANARGESAGQFERLREALGYESKTLAIGYTLWTEEAFVHNSPVVFGQSVRDSLIYLTKALKDGKSIVTNQTSLASFLPGIRLPPATEAPAVLTRESDRDAGAAVSMSGQIQNLLTTAELANVAARENRDQATAKELREELPPPPTPHKSLTAANTQLAELIYKITTQEEDNEIVGKRVYDNPRVERESYSALLAKTETALGQMPLDVKALNARLRRGGAVNEDNGRAWVEDFTAIRQRARQNFDAALARLDQLRANTQPEERLPREQQYDRAGSSDEAYEDLTTELSRYDFYQPVLNVLSASRRNNIASRDERERSRAVRSRELGVASARALVNEELATRQETLDEFIDLLKDLHETNRYDGPDMGADQMQSLIESKRRVIREELAPTDDDVALQEALISVYDQFVANSLGSPLNEAISGVQEKFKNNPVFITTMRTRVRSLTSKFNVYVERLSNERNPLFAGDFDDEAFDNIESDEIQKAQEELATLLDPNDTVKLLRRLRTLYENRITRLVVQDAVLNVGDKIDIEGVGRVPYAVVRLLVPAAIEMAKDRGYGQASEANRTGKYRLAHRGDVPQALRLAEIVREYCAKGSVPLPLRVWNTYADFSSALNSTRPGEIMRKRVRYSRLISPQDRAEDIDGLDEDQLYCVTNGVHHHLPFGADVQLSALWVRLMRVYLSVQRVMQIDEENQRSTASAILANDNAGGASGLVDSAANEESARQIRSLNALHEAIDDRSRLLTRAIAKLPRAGVRLALHLNLLFARRTQRVRDLPVARQSLASVSDTTLAFFPHLEEMRAIDARLLCAVVLGYDYSPLRRREANDALDPERFETAAQEIAATEGDAAVPDASYTVDGRDAVAILDTRYTFRRGAAIKEVLVDAYYRAVIEYLFENGSKDNPGDQVRYVITRRLRTEPRQPPIAIQYNQFVEPNRFGTLPSFSGSPLARAAEQPEVFSKFDAFVEIAKTNRLIGRAEALGAYTQLVRDPKFDVTQGRDLRDKPVANRPLKIEQVGGLERMSIGDAVRSLTIGEGIAIVQRTIAAAILRQYLIGIAPGNAKTLDEIDAIAFRARQDGDDVGERRAAAYRIVFENTIYEPAWHLVSRAALVGALQILGDSTRYVGPIVRSAIETLSLRVENQGHLWHDDVPPVTAAQRAERELSARAELIDLDAIEEAEAARASRFGGDGGAEVRGEEALDANDNAADDVRNEIVRTPTSAERAEKTAVKNARIAARTNYDAAGFRDYVQRRLASLMRVTAVEFGQSVTMLPPTGYSQALLDYASDAVYADRGVARQFLEVEMRQTIEFVRRLLADQNGLGSVKVAELERLIVEQRVNVENNAETSNVPARLAYLLIRAEARRRSLWARFVRLGSKMVPEEIGAVARRAASENEDDNYGPNWYAMFYDALERTLSRQSNIISARTIITEYAATSQTARAFIDSRPIKAAIKPFELERYVPIDVVLEKLFYAGPNAIRSNLQMYPLLQLLVAPVEQRPVLRFETVKKPRSPDYQTMTRLAIIATKWRTAADRRRRKFESPPYAYYPATGAFTPLEIFNEANLLRLTSPEIRVLHEFVAETSKTTAVRYTTVSAVSRIVVEREAQQVGNFLQSEPVTETEQTPTILSHGIAAAKKEK